VSPLEERLRRLEDAAAIRTLDATDCRLLDDRDWPALVALFTPPAAAGAEATTAPEGGDA
jgi:hypothetical protein